MIRVLNNELRNQLKNPQGLLIKGSFKKTMEKLKELIKDENPTMIISVGDIVSEQMIKNNIPPKILVVDNKTMRKPIQPIEVDADETIYAKNPPGSLTKEAWDAIAKSVKNKGLIRIMIDGEEDLLTLPSVLSAPEKSYVVYGQPKVGIVVVRVTEKNRKRIQHIVNSMEESSKN